VQDQRVHPKLNQLELQITGDQLVLSLSAEIAVPNCN
jgi:hypothetical protein